MKRGADSDGSHVVLDREKNGRDHANHKQHDQKHPIFYIHLFTDTFFDVNSRPPDELPILVSRSVIDG